MLQPKQKIRRHVDVDVTQKSSRPRDSLNVLERKSRKKGAVRDQVLENVINKKEHRSIRPNIEV